MLHHENGFDSPRAKDMIDELNSTGFKVYTTLESTPEDEPIYGALVIPETTHRRILDLLNTELKDPREESLDLLPDEVVRSNKRFRALPDALLALTKSADTANYYLPEEKEFTDADQQTAPATQLQVIEAVKQRANLPGSTYAEAVIDNDFQRVIEKYRAFIDRRYDEFIAKGHANGDRNDYLALELEDGMLRRFVKQGGYLNFWDFRHEAEAKNPRYKLVVDPAQACFLANLSLTKQFLGDKAA
jgi:hypothetical protein